MTRPSNEEKAREVAAATGRSYDDALRLAHIESKTRITVAEGAFALGHPVAVLADGPTEPEVAGTDGFGPQLRNVHISYGSGRLPDFKVITSIPLPGEDIEDHLLTNMLSDFLRSSEPDEERRRTSARKSWDRAKTADPEPIEVIFAGSTTRGTRISLDGFTALHVPYLHGQVIVGSSGAEIPDLVLTD